MWISPKRYLRNAAGEIVEAGKGISGTLVVAEGGALSEDEAIKLGFLGGKGRPVSPVSQPIDRSTGKAQEQEQVSSVKPLIEGKPWEAPSGLHQTIGGPLPEKKEEPAALDLEK